MTVTIKPALSALDDWRRIYWRETFALSCEVRPKIEAGAKAVRAIIDRGPPVYGINTGLGKLVSVRIEDADLAKLPHLGQPRGSRVDGYTWCSQAISDGVEHANHNRH